jgi:hypothetical protein
MRARDWYLRTFGWIPRPVRQLIIGVIGGTLLLLAVAGMVLPVMPGVIFLPLALAILAAEFAWATRWLIKIRRTARDVMNGSERAPWPARFVRRCRDWCLRCWRRLRGLPVVAAPAPLLDAPLPHHPAVSGNGASKRPGPGLARDPARLQQPAPNSEE